jgi:Protein of unknown function (DUF402)
VRSGDPVLVRSVYRGRVRFAFPHRFVATEGDHALLYLAVGTRGVWMGRDRDGRYLERWIGADEPHAHVWSHHHFLWLARPEETHMLGVKWDESWRFLGWYVHLQSPISRTPLGFDTCDLALDIEVDPDGSWRWKDEDDFAELQELGALDPATAAAVREEGERVIAAKPWPTGWEDWRPDQRWGPPQLPDGWDVV